MIQSSKRLNHFTFYGHFVITLQPQNSNFMKKGLLSLALGTFGLGIAEYVMMSILPELAATFDVSIAQAGHLISAYAIGVCIGAPLIVIISRNWPLRRILIMLMATYIVGNLCFALAPQYGVALAARVLSGLPHGAYFGTGALVASRLAGEGKSASGVALMCMGMTVANLLGVPLGSFIGNVMTWRYVFIFNIGWGLLTLLAIRRFIPVLPALPKSNIKGQFRFLKSPAPWLLSGATLLGNGGVFCMYSYVTPLMTEDAGAPMSFIPVLMLLVGAGMCIGTYYGGTLSDRYTPVKVARIIEITIIVTLTGLYLFSCNIFAAVALVCLAATALFAISPPMQLLLIRYSPGAELMGGAMIQIAFNLGNAVGALCGGLPIESGAGPRYSALIGAGFAVLGTVCLYLFSPRKYPLHQ